ncbi:MAG: hypothetical protein D6695_08240 [Planctomycetota bacterium]|nr:MAG: hypothetical protein D6695_08240 [Planctomycetota bacterium]
MPAFYTLRRGLEYLCDLLDQRVLQRRVQIGRRGLLAFLRWLIARSLRHPKAYIFRAQRLLEDRLEFREMGLDQCMLPGLGFHNHFLAGHLADSDPTDHALQPRPGATGCKQLAFNRSLIVRWS